MGYFAVFSLMSNLCQTDVCREHCSKVWLGAPPLSRTRRPKARGLAQHGLPSGWLEESDPARCYFMRDGRSMPPALTDHTTYPGPGLIYD
jgi:hypothetical protein